jgi:hypothetical protein
MECGEARGIRAGPPKRACARDKFSAARSGSIPYSARTNDTYAGTGTSGDSVADP